MAENRDVWVFVERHEAGIAPVSLELVGKARELADQLSGQVCGLLFGGRDDSSGQDLSHKLIEHGADRVLLAEHDELAFYRTLPYAQVAIGLVRQWQPYIFLLGATPVGRDLAPRIASAVSAGLTADCTDLKVADFARKGQVYPDLLHQIRPAFGGNIIATIVNPEMHPQMATVREGVFKLGQLDADRYVSNSGSRVVGPMPRHFRYLGGDACPNFSEAGSPPIPQCDLGTSCTITSTA